jgi:hypothetical protein
MRMRRRPGLRGELVYLSEAKLLSLASQLGVKARWFETDVAVEATGRAAAPLAPGTGVSAQASVHAKRVDPRQRERSVERLLDDVVQRLDRLVLPDLDRGGGALSERGWFRFHRRLRFGVGTDNSTRSVRELVMVDREPVVDDGYVPGLLMNGSARHLQPPFRPADPDGLTGNRSGSNTGHLFRWLHDARRALDEDPAADLDALDVPLLGGDFPRECRDLPVQMYRLFANPDWMYDRRFPQLLDHAPCEGVAQASLITRHNDTAVVMGSPLYMRARPLDHRVA